MSLQTNISWTDATWNPWQGCHKISAGCMYCYMYRDKKRYGQDPTQVIRSKHTTFQKPLTWTKAKVGTGFKVFTCSWSDFFIEDADPWRPLAWEIIRQTPHLTYQILTKRPERFIEHLPWWDAQNSDWSTEPWPNVWLGVSVENQAMADQRIPLLRQTPAAMRFLSIEPLLAPVLLQRQIEVTRTGQHEGFLKVDHLSGIDWVIVGGESGPSARPCHVAWIHEVVEQCKRASVPCWVKQLGSRAFYASVLNPLPLRMHLKHPAGADLEEFPAYLQIQEFPSMKV